MPRAKTKSKNTITVAAMSRRYWKGAASELSRLGYVSDPDEGKGGAKRYKLLKEIPDRSDVRDEAVAKFYTQGIQSRLEDANSEIESLRDEMEEWQSALEGAEMESVPKYEEVTECVDYLECAREIEDTTAPECVADLSSALDLCGRTSSSRGDRLSDALAALECIVDTVEELLEDEDSDLTKDEKDAVESFRDDIRNAVDELYSVSFPGMY